jgi:hypothetical protein
VTKIVKTLINTKSNYNLGIKLPTDKQIDWLKRILSGEVTKSENPRKYSAYMRRIQKQFDDRLANWLWVAENMPDVLKDEEREYTDETLERHRRLKILLRICLLVNPLSEDPTLVEMIGQLVPRFDIELVKKPPLPPKPLEVSKCKKCDGLWEDKDLKDGKCPQCNNSVEKVE